MSSATEMDAKSMGRKLGFGTFASVLLRVNFLVWPLILMTFALGFFHENFLSYANFTSVTRITAIYVIMGVGQTFVMTSGNIDLSIGSMIALVGALTGHFIVSGGNALFAIPLAMFLGGLLGTLNGLVVAWLKVPALLATLGTLIAFRGVVHQFMYGSYYVRFPKQLTVIGQGFVGAVPVPSLIALAVLILGFVIFKFTKFGRYMTAIGGNEEAAVLAGLNVRFWKTAAFTFQGSLVGLAAVILMARLDAAHPSVGALMELHVIAGVVLGGTLLAGGYGTIVGMAAGMLLIAVLENGLLLAGAGFFYQQMVLGALIIAAVAYQGKRNSDSLIRVDA